MNKSKLFRVSALVAVLSLGLAPSADAASKSKIDAYFKKIYRQMVTSGNNDAIAAMTYYDVEIKQAIGRVLDGKVRCDANSKAMYKSKAFSSLSSEVDQFVNGFYLGYCNAR